VSVFRTIAVYLGLGPDDEYDDGYAYDEPADERREPERGRQRPPEREVAQREPETRPAGRGSRSRVAAPAIDDEPSAVSSVRSLRPVPDESPVEPVRRAREPERARETGSGERREDESTVRPVALPRSKPSALSPQSFSDAKVVADEFKKSVPVIINLQGLDRDLVRRLVDFSSGLCYGLDGHMEKIASQVFLLTPKSVEVSAEDRRRIEERGFDR
jgi:cell division inhibitor SepF